MSADRTYEFDAGFPETVSCTFRDCDDGLILDRAMYCGADLEPHFRASTIKLIETEAYRFFERREFLCGGPELIGLRPLEHV